MLKKSQGNMYDWVTHTHSHLGGQCPHECSYCYAQRNRWGVSPRYQGPIRLIEKEFDVNYGKRKIIFIEHMNDMFADGVSKDFVHRILLHCHKFPENKYVFQTKNPSNAFSWLSSPLVKHFMIGTTIESNRIYWEITKAPTPIERYAGLRKFSGMAETFVTIEPILDFDIDVMICWLSVLRPSFVNIGADSKRCKLPEPSSEKIRALIAGLLAMHINIKKKTNLKRIL